MGEKTAAQLIDEALNLAGDTRLTTPALTWLNSWLRSTYGAWPWPFLMRRNAAVSLVTGATGVDFGAGSVVTNQVKRVFDPIWVYNSTRTSRVRARIRTLVGGHIEEDETAMDSATNRGIPTQFKVRSATSGVWGKWSLIPNPIPDRDYLLAIEWQEMLPNLTSTSTVPAYPNDRTMVQAVYAEALRYMKDQTGYKDALQILASQVADDRMKFGEVTGTNDQISIDPNVFRY